MDSRARGRGLGMILLQLKRAAFPDNIQQCSFDGFANYSPSQNTIVIAGKGELPLAHFSCP